MINYPIFGRGWGSHSNIPLTLILLSHCMSEHPHKYQALLMLVLLAFNSPTTGGVFAHNHLATCISDAQFTPSDS